MRQATGCTAVSEREWQRTVVDAAQLLGWVAFHVYDSRRSAAGWPDLFLCHPGQQRCLACELKTETGKVTAAQQAYLNLLNCCGVLAIVARPSDWDWLVELLRGPTPAPKAPGAAEGEGEAGHAVIRFKRPANGLGA